MYKGRRDDDALAGIVVAARDGTTEFGELVGHVPMNAMLIFHRCRCLLQGVILSTRCEMLVFGSFLSAAGKPETRCSRYLSIDVYELPGEVGADDDKSSSSMTDHEKPCKGCLIHALVCMIGVPPTLARIEQIVVRAEVVAWWGSHWTLVL